MTLLQQLLAVYVAYIVATASPGPSNMAIMATAMSRGRTAALALAAGVVTGSMFWATLAASGLSALLAASAEAVTVIRIAGGLYLLYLAFRSARAALAREPVAIPVTHAGGAGYGALYRRGLLLHLTNAKAILAWIAIMSLGIEAGMGTYVLPLMLAGCVVLGIAIFCGYALVFSSAPAVAAYRAARRWIEGAMAAFFFYAGFHLLAMRN